VRTPKIPTLLMLVLSLGLVAAACSSGNPSTSPAPTTSGGATSPSQMVNDHGTKDLSGKAETSVELDNFYFAPTVLKGTAGQKLKLELENESGTLHNFTLEAQNIDQDVEPGKKTEVTVTFSQSGSLQFFCKYHKALGMAGELST